MADTPTDLFLGGKWVPASSGGRFDVYDPATGDVLASVADGTVRGRDRRGRRRGRRGRGLGRHRAARSGRRSCAARSS